MNDQFTNLLRPIRKSDLEAIARIHMEVFPSYFLSQLGIKFIVRFYSMFVDSVSHIGYVAEVDGQPVGFVVGTTNARELYRTFYRKNFFRTAFLIVWNTLTNPVVRGGLNKRISHVITALKSLANIQSSEPASQDANFLNDAEASRPSLVKTRLLSIGVLNQFRGTGVAASLASRFLARCNEVNVDVVGLSVKADNDSAIRFYEKNGWLEETRTRAVIFYYTSTSKTMLASGENIEILNIRERYRKRRFEIESSRYSVLKPWVYMTSQELDRALLQWFGANFELSEIAEKTMLEIGCGGGKNLLRLISYGFSPNNIHGNDLISERIEEAAQILPGSVHLYTGDAASERFPANMDFIVQSMVFSSILDPKLQQQLASNIWNSLAVGGYVIWYDFVYNNPSNPDVRGIPLRHVRELFPAGEIQHQMVTLAPPLSRAATRVSPAAYTLLNFMPFLRTHLLCFIKKNEQ